MGLTDGLQVQDTIIVELVDCAPTAPPETPAAVPLPDPPDASPTAHAAEATIEQTGAGPPPED